MLPFELETAEEERLAASPSWQEGVVWGKPRRGHQEGAVMYHIADVLKNIDHEATSPEERRALRLIALVHDTFKYKVDDARPAKGANHHAAIARAFAEKYIDDTILLDLVERHDDAYNAWRKGAYGKKDWNKARECADDLIEHLGDALPLYVRFYHADNNTESKDQAPLTWFEGLVRDHGVVVEHGSGGGDVPAPDGGDH